MTMLGWPTEKAACNLYTGKPQQWKPFILNWYNPRISTGKLEAANRKIGTLQRNACGYRDEEYLKLRIYNIHTSTYALTGRTLIKQLNPNLRIRVFSLQFFCFNKCVNIPLRVLPNLA